MRYTDTAGFTDHVFEQCHLLGFRFAPRIRELADNQLYVPDKERDHPTIAPLIGGKLNLKLMPLGLEQGWEILEPESPKHAEAQ